MTQAYWAIGTAREGVRVLEQAVARSEAWVREVGARVDAGVLPPNDVATARAQRARRPGAPDPGAATARGIRTPIWRASSAPRRATRFELGDAVRSHASRRSATSIAAGTDALVKRALEQRPERAGFDERQSALRSSSEAARAAVKPQLSGLAAVEPARPNPLFIPRSDQWRMSWNLGVQATWTIWDGGRAQAEAAATEAQAQAVGHRRQQFDEMVAFEVRQRMGDVASGRAALAASDEAVAAALEAHRVLQERFDAGVATPTDVFDAQLARLDAELERVRLQAALRLSEARLLRALGQPW